MARDTELVFALQQFFNPSTIEGIAASCSEVSLTRFVIERGGGLVDQSEVQEGWDEAEKCGPKEGEIWVLSLCYSYLFRCSHLSCLHLSVFHVVSLCCASPMSVCHLISLCFLCLCVLSMSLCVVRVSLLLVSPCGQLGSPRYTYAVMFPLVFWWVGAVPGGVVLMASALSEWMNIALKW